MSQPRHDAKACPICGKPVEQRFRPFCSRRCADIDLGHWLKGSYTIPSPIPPEGEEENLPENEPGEEEK